MVSVVPSNKARPSHNKLLLTCIRQRSATRLSPVAFLGSLTLEESLLGILPEHPDSFFSGAARPSQIKDYGRPGRLGLLASLSKVNGFAFSFQFLLPPSTFFLSLLCFFYLLSLFHLLHHFNGNLKFLFTYPLWDFFFFFKNELWKSIFVPIQVHW